MKLYENLKILFYPISSEFCNSIALGVSWFRPLSSWQQQHVDEGMEQCWNDADGGNRSRRKKTCHSATLSTTSPTRADLERNPGPHDDRPATDRLSHGKAL